VRLVEVCSPYLGTVLAVRGVASPAAWRLAQALRDTSRDICAGTLDDVTTEEVQAAMALPPDLASRYLQRLKDTDEGLVPDGAVDTASLDTLVGLRRRYQNCVHDGADLLAAAADPSSGLVTPWPAGA